MGKQSGRARREELNRFKVERRRAQRELRRRQKAEGLKPFETVTLSNGKSEWETVEQEKEARQETVEEQVKVFRSVLPTLLKRLARIRDPRNPKTIQHKFTVVMIYGLLTFVFQMASRREANRKMTRPMFLQNLKLLFPEVETLPHHDTLNRLLADIDVEQIQQALIEIIQRFIRRKKFYRYLVANCYPIAIDGTQKFTRQNCWAAECLEREVGNTTDEDKTQRQYYVYVLEASLAFANGMTIPLMSEFLSYEQGDQQKNKQDCELKAFKRLARRLKDCFPRLPILVLLDGLYPNGPIIELCRQYHWQFMIVLQDGSLPSVWEEVRGLGGLQPGNRLDQQWGGRIQKFRWVNDIEYRYGNNDRKRQVVHVVICQEHWEEVDPASAEVANKTSRHVWISNEPLTQANVHERCNLGGRHRWAIESNILVEKRHGYQYEHCFSYNWNAMKGYHYLMRLGHLINALVQKCARLVKLIRVGGLRGLIDFLRETYAAPWLDAQRIQLALASPYQLRLD
jgi:hypothetical protein